MLLLVSSSLWAVEYNTSYINGVKVLTIEGEIVRFQEKIDDYLPSDAHTPLLVILRLTGGDMGLAIGIASKLRRKNSYIIVDDYCFSACTNIFVGGASLNRRYAVENATFGFHGVTIYFGDIPVVTMSTSVGLKEHMNPAWMDTTIRLYI